MNTTGQSAISGATVFFSPVNGTPGCGASGQTDGTAARRYWSVPAGQYDVALSATHYDSQWYSNARSHAGATPVTVSDGQQYSYTAALELRNLTAGRTSSVAFRLNRAGARLLRRAPPKVKATLTLSFTSGGRTTMARSTIVLRRR